MADLEVASDAFLRWLAAADGRLLPFIEHALLTYSGLRLAQHESATADDDPEQYLIGRHTWLGGINHSTMMTHVIR